MKRGPSLNTIHRYRDFSAWRLHRFNRDDRATTTDDRSRVAYRKLGQTIRSVTVIIRAVRSAVVQ